MQLLISGSVALVASGAVARRHSLTWFGHVECTYQKIGSVLVGSQKWLPPNSRVDQHELDDCVIEDLNRAGFGKEDAQDRVVWSSGTFVKCQIHARGGKTLKRL